MKRILLIGNSPLPEENAAVRPAAGLRTWQFLKGLERAGVDFNIRLVAIDMPECRSGDGRDQQKEKEVSHEANKCPGGSEESIKCHDNGMTKSIPGGCFGFTITGDRNSQADDTNVPGWFTISKNDPVLVRKLQSFHDEFHPDVIISVNTYPSYLAAGLKSLAPLWADLNGWIMAEAQAQAYKMDSNDYLEHYFEMEKRVIGAADKFSAVSKAECLALYGELAWAGRLNKESFGYKFVEHVPNGAEWYDGEEDENRESVNGLAKRQDNVITRGSAGDTESFPGDNAASDVLAEKMKHVPVNAFVLLWVGGYNTWVDEFTLFKGVSEAMRKCPQLYFVSTGGALGGLDGRTFEKFKKMIEESELAARFIFLGWVETSEIPMIYARAQAGINVDRRCVETMTGARNRINEMMKFGLPVVTTLGSEIAGEVAAASAGLAVGSGDHAGLADAITSIYEAWRGGGGRENAEFKAYGKNGMKYVTERCNYEVTLAPLLAWLENPRPSPDRNVDVGFGGGGVKAKILMFWRYLRENGFRKSFKKFLQRVRM